MSLNIEPIATDGSRPFGARRQIVAQRRRVADRLASVRRVWGPDRQGRVGKSFLTAGLPARWRAPDGSLAFSMRISKATIPAFSAPRCTLHVCMTTASNRPLTRKAYDLFHGAALETAAPGFRGPTRRPSCGAAPSRQRPLREFLADVAWGALDSCLWDLPPACSASRSSPICCRHHPVLAVTIPTPESLRGAPALRGAIDPESDDRSA